MRRILTGGEGRGEDVCDTVWIRNMALVVEVEAHANGVVDVMVVATATAGWGGYNINDNGGNNRDRKGALTGVASTAPGFEAGNNTADKIVQGLQVFYCPPSEDHGKIRTAMRISPAPFL